MQLTYLIKNEETKNRFLEAELPDGVVRGAVGTYEADGGKLYILSFSANGSTITGARALSKVRGRLRDDVSTRLLVDDASLKFAYTLYPRFAEYERKLRHAITLATCAEHDNFDNRLVKSLEELTLEQLGRQLFFDTSFQDKVKSRTKDCFTKNEVIDFITRLREKTVWMKLFGEESLSSVRENYFVLCDMRNKVMHHKLITEKNYDRARKMLRRSIDELDAYVDKVRSDVSYPKRHAARAVDAAKLIRENYESMFQNLSGSLEWVAAATSAARKLSSQIDTSSLAPLVAQTAGIQEAISKNQEMWASMAKSLSDRLGAVQNPGLTSAMEAIGQQTQLQKLMPNEALAGFASPAIDFSALGASALLNVDVPALSSLDGLGSFAIDADDGMNREDFDEGLPDEDVESDSET